MIRKDHFLIFLAALLLSFPAFSQGERKDKTAVTYEEIYDEPYSINKLFVALQPLYGELFVTNVNVGFGAEVTYYLKDKMDFHGHFRKTYGQKFFDFSRDLAMKTGDVDNRIQIYNYYEIGATYHVKDFEQSSKTKMFLFKNSYKGNKWSARVPLNAEIPCKVRKIYGVRLGALMYKSATDLNRAMEKQGLTNFDLKNTDGSETSLPATHTVNSREQQLDVFTNVYATGIYLGGSMSWIRNVAVNFDKFEEGIDDLMFTTFVDLIYAPSVRLDDVYYTDKDPVTNPSGQQARYSVSPLKTQAFGFRVGIDGKFNRTWGWSYGGELGMRPSLQGRTFYALVKISFPVFGTNLDYKVESFGK